MAEKALARAARLRSSRPTRASASPPHASSCSHGYHDSARRFSSSSRSARAFRTLAPFRRKATHGSSANAGIVRNALRARRTSSSAAPSKYSMAASHVIRARPRTAIVKSDRLGLARSSSRHTSTEHRQKAPSSSSQITPSVPHAANEQVNCVHRRNSHAKNSPTFFAFGISCGRGSTPARDRPLGHKAKLAAVANTSPRRKGDTSPSARRHTHRFNVPRARRIGVTARADALHATMPPKRCRCLSVVEVGREKLRGCGFTEAEPARGEAFIVPARRVETRLLQHVAQLHERKARLHMRTKKRPSGRGACLEHAVHARRVRHAAARGDRAPAAKPERAPLR